MNKWLCGLLLHCRLWPLHTIPCRKKMRKCAKLYFAGLPTLWQRKRNKVGCQQESQVKAPGGGEKFFLLVKVGTAFVFVLFVILILRRRNWAKTGLKLQGNVIYKVVRHWRVYDSRPKLAYGRQGLGWDPRARIKFGHVTFWGKKQFADVLGAEYWWFTLCIVASAAFC